MLSFNNDSFYDNCIIILQISDSLLPYILDALRNTIVNLNGMQPTKMQLTLRKSESYLGLFPNEAVKGWITDMVNGFKQKIENEFGKLMFYSYVR